MSKEKPWGGRFTKPTNELVEEYTASISYDYKLAAEDLEGSIAHAKMLSKTEIISEGDKDLIVNGLEQIKKRLTQGNFLIL